MNTNDNTAREKSFIRRIAGRPLVLVGISAAVLAALAGTGVGIAAAATASSNPTTVKIIDAKTDPAAAQAALALYSGATNTDFTPTSAPVYSSTGWGTVYDADGQAAQSVTGNAQTGQSVSESITVSHEQGSSWSLGGSLEISGGVNILDVVDAELSATVTANHTWDSSDSDGQTIRITAVPGQTVWLESNISTGTVTGNFTFDVNGTRYEVDDVTITQPASPVTGTKAASAYRVMQRTATEVGLPANTAGGLHPINTLPLLKDYIAQGN